MILFEKKIAILIAVTILTGCALPTGDDPTYPGGSAESCDEISGTGDVYQFTVDAWKDVMGPLDPQCALEALEYNVVCIDDILSECECGYGCINVQDREIFLSAKQNALENRKTLAHEFLHAIRKCVSGSVDPNHADSNYWILSGGEGSIENRSLKLIEEKYDNC